MFYSYSFWTSAYATKKEKNPNSIYSVAALFSALRLMLWLTFGRLPPLGRDAVIFIFNNGFNCA